MKAPYRILKIRTANYELASAQSVSTGIPTMKEAVTVMTWMHNHSAACDMVIVDSEGKAIKRRHKSGFRTAKTVDCQDSPLWQRLADDALSQMTADA